jgi:hypothetical protein
LNSTDFGWHKQRVKGILILKEYHNVRSNLLSSSSHHDDQTRDTPGVR